MDVEKTPIDGLTVLRPKVFEDSRGFFLESYNENLFRDLGLRTHWAQDNHSRSVRGTLRGLHFQLGEGQAKLFRCVLGTIWDVGVDLRPDSPTFGRWHGVELSAENKKMFLLAEGFAHGFVVLSDVAECLYKCSTVYDQALESEIAWNDPEVGIEWPVADPILSERDQNAQSLAEYMKIQGIQRK